VCRRHSLDTNTGLSNLQHRNIVVGCDYKRILWWWLEVHDVLSKVWQATQEGTWKLDENGLKTDLFFDIPSFQNLQKRHWTLALSEDSMSATGYRIS
jgi:hypothetical protein